MKLLDKPHGYEEAARLIEAFAQRVRLGLVKRYGIISLERTVEDAKAQEVSIAHFMRGTTVTEDLAFLGAHDVAKDVARNAVRFSDEEDE